MADLDEINEALNRHFTAHLGEELFRNDPLLATLRQETGHQRIYWDWETPVVVLDSLTGLQEALTNGGYVWQGQARGGNVASVTLLKQYMERLDELVDHAEAAANEAGMDTEEGVEWYSEFRMFKCCMELLDAELKSKEAAELKPKRKRKVAALDI